MEKEQNKLLQGILDKLNEIAVILINKKKERKTPQKIQEVKIWDLEEKLTQMEAVEGSIDDILATYIRYKMEFSKTFLKPTDSQSLTSLYKRFGRIAKEISEIKGINNSMLQEAMSSLVEKDKREKNSVGWTLETVLKQFQK